MAPWRVYGAWNRRECPDRAPPMDRRLVLAVAWSPDGSRIATGRRCDPDLCKAQHGSWADDICDDRKVHTLKLYNASNLGEAIESSYNRITEVSSIAW